MAAKKLRVDHWEVDFGIGRDFGLGNDHAEWTFGVRVADLRSTLNVNAHFTLATAHTTVGAGNVATEQRSTFVGAGPWLGVQGDIPLGNQWSIDWLGGAAVLFGERAVTLTGQGATVGGSVSDRPAVFNVDAEAGLSYWFSPTLNMTASYGYDEYFKVTLGVASTNLVSTAL
jgi:Legionella pneumophila major outer membrane protein precursor